MNKSEPPQRERTTASFLLVGRNSRGQWVVQDPRGIRGGLFVNCAGALKFAKSENALGSRGVMIVSGPLELNIAGAPRESEPRAASDGAPLERVA